MLSGREALGSIDRAVRRAQEDAAALDRDLAELTERRLHLSEQEGQACRELALFRLKQVAGGEMISALTAAEERARKLIRQRAETVAALDVRIAEIESRQAELSRIHDTCLAELEAARLDYAAAEEAVLRRLAESQQWQEHARRADTTERIARHAEEKTHRAEADRRIKGRPYEADPLFMYLWNRGYGTSKYDRGLLARFFDRRIAKLVGFGRVRANYAMLLEIPRRLHEHAERRRADADEAAAQLDRMEADALRDSEATTPAKRLAQAERALAAAEQQMEAAEIQANDLAGTRAEIASGEDAETRAAITEISGMLQDTDIRRLRNSARVTPLPDDDHIVERIAVLEADIDSIDRELQSSRERQLEQRRRLAELDRIRREYRQRGYAASDWDFRDAGMVAVLLAQLLGGVLSRDGFWGHMNRRRLPGPFPGGWGKGGRRARMPVSRRGARLSRPPRSARGGGFRTTGSF